MGNLDTVSRFRRGSGCFVCECCGRRTRMTHEMQDRHYCEPCDNALTQYNAFQDGCCTREQYEANIKSFGVKCQNHALSATEGRGQP